MTFGTVDLAKLAPWLGSTENPPRFVGSAEATLRIDGPVANWRELKAELRIPQFRVGPAPNIDVAAGALTVNNEGPVVVRIANSAVSVESAHFV